MISNDAFWIAGIILMGCGRDRFYQLLGCGLFALWVVGSILKVVIK